MKKIIFAIIVVLTIPAHAIAQATAVSIFADIKGGRWSVFSAPAVGSQATATKAAGAAGIRHVVDCITFAGGAAVPPVAAVGTVNLRDGATAAGTVIWSTTVVIPAAAGNTVPANSICGLNLVGSAATAMTLEWAGALGSMAQSVTLTGYDTTTP